MPAEPVVPLLTSAEKSVRKGTGGALRSSASVSSAQLPVLFRASAAKEVNKKMLRLLILFLIIQGSAATEDTEGNSSADGDDEDGDEPYIREGRHYPNLNAEAPGGSPGLDKSTGDEAGGGTLIIIIAAVSVAVLAIVCVVAFVLFRRYSQSREQGVYSVPVEQGQKAAV